MGMVGCMSAILMFIVKVDAASGKNSLNSQFLYLKLNFLTSASQLVLNHCQNCSAFNCSFDEFVGEKVVSPPHSSAILAPRKYRSMEQNRKPRDKSTNQWTPYLRQRRQGYTMEKRQPL